MPSPRRLEAAVPSKPPLLQAGGQDRLELRVLFVAGDYVDLDFTESGRVEELVELRLGKAQPGVGVQFSGFVELMREEIEDRDPSASLQDAVSSSDRAGGADCVVQGL